MNLNHVSTMFHFIHVFLAESYLQLCLLFVYVFAPRHFFPQQCFYFSQISLHPCFSFTHVISPCFFLRARFFRETYLILNNVVFSTMFFCNPCFFAMLCYSPSCFKRAHPNLFYFEILQTQHGVEWLFEFWHVLWSEQSFLFKTSSVLFVKNIFLAYSFFNRIYLYIYSLSPILAIIMQCYVIKL